MSYNSLISPPESLISPAVSLAKSDSSISYYNEYLVDDPSNERSRKEELDNKSLDLQLKNQRYLGNGGIDSHIWFPPEPEDHEDDIEGSVATYDDDEDEEYVDGVKWGKPSNLSSLEQEGSASFRLKEETKKVMDDVMNGKFKTLVEHLLQSMGISCSENDDDDDNWVDTVTALSWEAASHLKPDAFEGKAMDPDGYVKVKCISTGARSQSEVFKGLVFKKHAAHKRMPTKFKKPKLLLIKGALSVSSDGLSSLNAMKQESSNRADHVTGMIEKLNPNVVLVEKTVSRDIQESILAKGMTLVLEMKQHRLERIARCTGSPILSSDNLSDQKLRQCESFYFEKIVEEHAEFSESGKKPKKTLMFLEGVPTRMGFTILLKGSHSDELKRIKCVVQFSVIMAYHMILENSFILNQRAMFSTTAPNGMAIFPNNGDGIIPSITGQPMYDKLDDTNVPISNETSPEDDSITTVDIPISNGSDENGSGSDNLGLEGSTLSSYEPYDPIVLSGLSSLSASLHEVSGLPLFNTNQQTMSTYLSYNGLNYFDQDLNSLEGVDTEVKDDFHEAETFKGDQMQSSSTYIKSPLEMKDSEDHMQRKDDISAVLDSESILVLMSRRNVTRGITCKQSSFSCIKFYRNFDVPLGKFLRDNLLNQKLSCGTCNELPEAHLHYYAHHNKQLTIQVKRLPSDKHLSGQNEGKLWMWSCCGQCKVSNGSLKSTKRVLVSVAARGLSFGKFLELGFSNHSSWDEVPSSCGHSFYKDYLHFFGLGSMVAMFRYSTVATYSVSLPLWKVEFHDSVQGDFLKNEVEDVLQEGQKIFSEVENSLKNIEKEYVGSLLNLQGSSKSFSDIKEMLKLEQDQFQGDMKKLTANTSDVSVDKLLYKPLYLNYMHWELLLYSYIWVERLFSLLSSELKVCNPQINIEDTDSTVHVQSVESASDNVPVLIADSTEEMNSLRSETIAVEGDEGLSMDSSNQVEANQENGVHGDLTLSSQKGENGEIFSFVLSTKLADPKGWMWTSFSQIENMHLNDIQRGLFSNYEPTNSYKEGSTIYKIITEEGSKLHFPVGSGNHIVSDYEDELSSLIACALAKMSSENLNDETKSYDDPQRLSSLSSPNLSSFASMESNASSFSFSADDSRFSSFNGLEAFDSDTSSGQPHRLIHLERSDKKPKYTVGCLFAKEFLELRGQCGLSELDYISSISRCKNWNAKGGKSKSFFAKTIDDRFIIKEIKNTEFYSFILFGSNYFGYMNECFNQGNQTCLAKILGIYQVMKRKSGEKHDLMVMENVMYGRKITRQYDLKGALYARYNAAVDSAGDVLLDQNFVNDMNVSPLYVSIKAKRNLQRAVWNDTAFLKSIGVMDYSLLVGVDSEKKELVCGIIDYVRQYTWDKQLENWVKSFVIPKNQMPTIISPKEYKKRFRKFIDTNFLTVPNDWCSQRSSNRCSLCGSSSDPKSHKLEHGHEN
ncbi:putative 1-phosphatidylinositol-3-phosphate 5-kinase FAB1D [Rutidosis leptorrhynchoides]|uniref:putative 1-phosphatidylinositol-3-phosphate 5-kinase FAB1D n=1 Tax=Rutidosis leptorrhynchoides TaxID=125765 RepID=UPI003A99009D